MRGGGGVLDPNAPERLGQAYEEKLRETDPERRKSQGIHYTPPFVVDYLVRETLGPLLEGATPERAESITIVDPACGSGVFLLAAYRYLLEWFELREGARLSPARRERILRESIFGVDLDSEAIELAKASLSLVADVDEPLDLSANIQRGDALFGEAWERLFPRVFAEGGFDIVLGNPPYFNVAGTWGKRDPRLDTLKSQFAEVHNDKTDISYYFLKRAVDICKGEIGLIVPRAFLEAYKADKLRSFLSTRASVREVLDFGGARVFPGAAIATAIVRLTKAKAETATLRRYLEKTIPRGADPLAREARGLFESVEVPGSALGATSWVFSDEKTARLLQKIDAAGRPIGEILHVGQGMQTGQNAVFGARTAEEIEAWEVPGEVWFARARNSDILRFRVRDRGERVLYLEGVDHFEDLPRGVREHLLANKEKLLSRAAHRRGDCEWWRYTWPLHGSFVRRPRIFCPYLAASNRFAVDLEGKFLGLTDTTVLYEKGLGEDLRYLVAVLNSKALEFRFRFLGKLKSGATREYFENTVSRLPIPRLARDDRRYGRLCELEEQARLSGHARPDAQTEIDEIVYGLFGLTAEEIELVELKAYPRESNSPSRPSPRPSRGTCPPSSGP